MARIDDLEKGLCDAYGVQVVAEIGDDGKEYGDPVPVAPPVGLTRSPSLAEQIRSMVRRELSDAAHDQGMETFEESDDFDVDDDPAYRDWETDRKSTRLNSSHITRPRMPSSA